jgi:hypothetical protein
MLLETITKCLISSISSRETPRRRSISKSFTKKKAKLSGKLRDHTASKLRALHSKTTMLKDHKKSDPKLKKKSLKE